MKKKAWNLLRRYYVNKIILKTLSIKALIREVVLGNNFTKSILQLRFTEKIFRETKVINQKTRDQEPFNSFYDTPIIRAGILPSVGEAISLNFTRNL